MSKKHKKELVCVKRMLQWVYRSKTDPTQYWSNPDVKGITTSDVTKAFTDYYMDGFDDPKSDASTLRERCFGSSVNEELEDYDRVYRYADGALMSRKESEILDTLLKRLRDESA